MASAPITQEPLRVVFCTCPSIYSTIVLKGLIASPHLKLVGVVESTRILRKHGWNLWDAFLLVRRTGLRYATYLWMVTSLYTHARRLLGRDTEGAFLKRQQIPVLTTRNINGTAGIEFVKRCNPELLLSAHFNQLIGLEILGLPPSGCLNIHPGQLPEYKGVDPVIHALARGEQQLGVTVHFQDLAFDTGPVITTGNVSLHGDDSLCSLNCKLFQMGIDLLLDTIAANGGIPAGAPQNSSDSYDSWPDNAVVAQVRQIGIKLVDIKGIFSG